LGERGARIAPFAREASAEADALDARIVSGKLKLVDEAPELRSRDGPLLRGYEAGAGPEHRDVRLQACLDCVVYLAEDVLDALAVLLFRNLCDFVRSEPGGGDAHEAYRGGCEQAAPADAVEKCHLSFSREMHDSHPRAADLYERT